MSEGSTDVFELHYTSSKVDLSWLEKPTQHQFRWRNRNGKWNTSKRRVRDHATLMKAFEGQFPTDLFVSTSSWLDPIGLPRLSDVEAPAPILLDHLIVFDIDCPPLCMERLEEAKVTALKLHAHVMEHEDLEFLHAVFSGSKGFHMFYRDKDRRVFSIPDPREREQEVRALRSALLQRVLDAGLEVDTRVTADTRRIIRLPGSLHGSSLHQCTIVPLASLEQPVQDLLDAVYRAEGAPIIPLKAPQTSHPEIADAGAGPQKATADKETGEIGKDADQPQFMLEVSTHVHGTKDRSVMLFWLPSSWGIGQKAMERAMRLVEDEHLGPCSFWEQGGRILMLCPQAMPRSQLIAIYRRHKLTIRAKEMQKNEHEWVRVSAIYDEETSWDNEIQPIGIYGSPSHLSEARQFSRPHLELERRMGVAREVESSSSLAGSEQLPLRIVSRG